MKPKTATLFIIFPLLILTACQPWCTECVEPQVSAGEVTLPVISGTSERDESEPMEMSCMQMGGEYHFHETQTELMTHPLALRVYLPPCYYADPAMRYPVLYLLHGQSFQDDQWDRVGADETLYGLVASGEIEPFIIVMPCESNYMNNSSDSKYGPAIAEELVPWMDSHYRTCTERDCRAIGGISRGSAWAMRTGLMYWETFGVIGAHSFPPFRGDFNAVPLWLQDMGEENYPQVWIDIGDQDPDLDAARVFKDRLVQYEVPMVWQVLVGGHTETYWARNVEMYLRWYAQMFTELASK